MRMPIVYPPGSLPSPARSIRRSLRMDFIGRTRETDPASEAQAYLSSMWSPDEKRDGRGMIPAMDIQLLSHELIDTYDLTKQAAEEHGERKTEFYEALDEKIEAEETLAQKTIRTPANMTTDAYVTQYYPGWRIVSGKAKTALIEEDPSRKKYVYLNREDGVVLKRNVIQATDSLDDEKLREEDPDLWERITLPATEVQALEAFASATSVQKGNGDLVFKITEAWIKQLESDGVFPRRLKAVDDMSNKDVNSMKKYLVPGKLTIKLDPPRKAKPDELDA
jgi:hypothetical protein